MTQGHATDSAGRFALPADAIERLERRVRRAARSRRSAIVSVTVPVDRPLDPVAVLTAARTEHEPWAVLEQPARDGAVVAGIGSAVELAATGERRFETVAHAWRDLLSRSYGDASDGAVAGSGPIAIGGFAFAPDGGNAREWQGFSAASLVVPEVAIARRGADVRLTASLLVEPGVDPQATLQRLVERVASLALDARMPELPSYATEPKVSGVAPPEHYLDAVHRATERIARGDFEKIVLARAVDVSAPAPIVPEAIFGVLREGFGDCHLVAVGRGDATFIAATPELLVRREGMRAATLALAGSARRSADPAVDAHLAEQLMRSSKDREEHELVVRRIKRALSPVAVWVAAADEPEVAQIANIQHLATPVRAQLTQPISAIELAGRLHPTPAVGGEPAEAALPAIPALEGLDRGWYAGPIGWTDSSEDGEFVVGLRSAVVRGSLARCYAGVGVVGASDPASELAETELKLGALLPVLSL